MAARYIKPAGRTYAPSAVLTLTVATSPLPARDTARAVPLAFSEAFAVYRTRRRGRWSSPLRRHFSRPVDVLPWVEQVASERTKTYCVAPIASAALTLCGFWQLATNRGAKWVRSGIVDGLTLSGRPAAGAMTFQRLIARGKPDIIQYSYHNKSYLWLSGAQYLPSPEEELARSIGYDWTDGIIADANGGPPVRSVRDRAELWSRLYCALADWWRDVDGGPWGATVGQLAEGYFRARVGPKSVLIHDDQYARGIERRAIHGGRASVWYLGDIGPRPAGPRASEPSPPLADYPAEPGPMLHLDVRSMYPWLLADRPFPVRLLGVKTNYTVKDVSELLNHVGVIATVQVDSRGGEYPCRQGDRVTYPVGVFDVALAGPELSAALASGEVLQVYAAATYQMGRPFARMATELLAARSVARDRGDACWELFVKLLSNSFAGKLAQRYARWAEAPGVPPERDWGEWHVLDLPTGTRRTFRSVAGLVWEYLPTEAKGRTLGSAFAYLTSYGRDHMRRIRESCPPQTVISQDTDGLWVLPEAADAIRAAGHRFGERPGELRLTATSDHGRFFSPKHYWHDGGWVLSGFHQPTRQGAGLTWQDHFTAAPLSGAPDHAPNVVWGFSRTVELTGIEPGGQVSPLGWVTPARVAH